MMILYLFRLNIWFDIEEICICGENIERMTARIENEEVVVLKIKDFMHEITRG